MQRILITGGGGGLGRYLVRHFESRGHEVIAVVRSDAGAETSSDAVKYVVADLADQRSVEDLSGRVGADFDLVVHCAVHYAPIHYASGSAPAATSDETWPSLQTSFAVNAFAPYLLSSRIIDDPLQRRPCSHIFINSEAIYSADERSAIYAASKAALRVLTSGVAAACRGTTSSASTLLLGPLGDERKMDQVRQISSAKDIPADDVVRKFLRRSNPSLVLDEFIDYSDCAISVDYLQSLGKAANGMLCKLDGGSSGSLV